MFIIYQWAMASIAKLSNHPKAIDSGRPFDEDRVVQHRVVAGPLDLVPRSLGPGFTMLCGRKTGVFCGLSKAVLAMTHMFNEMFIWRFPKMRVPPNGCFIGKIPLNPIKMDDLGYPYFRKPSYVLNFFDLLISKSWLHFAAAHSCWMCCWLPDLAAT